MATVTGLTADRMLQIEAESIVDGHVDVATGHLHLTRHDGTDIDAGYIVDQSAVVDIATDQANIDGFKTFLKALKSIQNITAMSGVAGAQVKIGNVGPGGVAGLEFGGATEYMGLVAGARVGLFLASAKVIDFQASGMAAIGTDHYFGPNALGAAGARLHFQGSGAGGVDSFVSAESDQAMANLNLRTKGTGLFRFQTNVGSTLFSMENSGDGHYYSGGAEVVRIETTQRRIAFFGNDNGLMGANAAGVSKYLIGLRPDISGVGTDHLVLYTYGGDVRFYPGGSERIRMSSGGDFFSQGDQAYFGANALGNPGGRLRLYAPAGDPANAYIIGESSGPNIGIHIQAKGAGPLSLRSGDGVDRLIVNSDGKLNISQNSGYFVTTATAGGANALPGPPVGYWIVNINGTDRKIPYWAT